MKRARRSSLESSFGAVLQAKRAAAQVSQERLAELSRLHRTYISQIERGLKSPSLRVVFAIAAALRIPAHTLIREAEQHMGVPRA